VSIGVAPTKVLAKVANRLAKKDKQNSGCVMVLDTEEKILDALKQTAVDELWGIGGRYANKLKHLWSIYDALQLRNMSEEWAKVHLGGVVGVRLIKELNGKPVMEMKDPLKQKKMIATTRMFGKPVHELNDLK
jgi:DNA polymerase V